MTDPASPFVEGTTITPAQPTTVEPTPATQVVAPAPVFTVPDSAKDLIGDGKKYANVEAALASLPHAQEHITKLESENAQVREQLTRSKTAEEFLAEVKKTNTVETVEAQPVPEVDLSVVEQMVANTITANEAQKVAQDNTKAVVDKLTAHYGSKEKAEEVYIEQATALGLGLAGLNQLAATSPDAVYKMLGLASGGSSNVHTTSTVNTEALGTQTKEPVAAPTIMAGATYKDSINAWNAAANAVNLQ